jgi:glycosyltransferase involved in cell wall biosynthesis
MRVAYVCADLGIPVFGTKGASIHVQEVIRAFLAQGYRVVLYAAKLGGSPPADLKDLEVHSGYLQLLGETQASNTVAAREVQAQQVAEMIMADLIADGQFDLVYERYSLWSRVGCEFAEQRGVPCILEVNAPLISEQNRHRSLVDITQACQIERRVFSAATSIVAVSEEVANYVRTIGGSHLPVHAIANGVNVERFASTAKVQRRSAEESVIGFVGTLKPWHGVDLLVRAFAGVRRRNPRTRLMVVGDGPMRESLVELAEELGVRDAIDWLGSVDASAVPTWLAKFDIAVAPYPRLEGFYFSPLKVFEYMAGGVPVVASRIGQISDIITDGVDGLLVDPGDIQQLQVALEYLLERPAERRLFARRGREKAIQSFDWNQVLERILATVDLPQVAGGNSEDVEHVRNSI